MRRYALKILSDRSTYFRWVLLAFADDKLEFQHSEAPCEFHTYDAALSEGMRALAAADAQLAQNRGMPRHSGS